jgi:hypothetical protein
MSYKVKIAVHYAPNVVRCRADPFAWFGGMDRMGHCQGRPTRWSESVLHEKDLAVTTEAGSFSYMPR